MAGVLVAGIGACSGLSSTTLPPTTGILIRAETLTSGKGCGPGPTQLFKYVVVAFGFGDGNAGVDPGGGPGPGSADPAIPESYQRPVAANIFDCYTDGAFVSLPASGENSTFRLEVFAYNRPAYEAARPALDKAGRPIQLDLRQYSSELRSTAPTWTTQCRATQLTNVQALASCSLLGPGTSGLGGATGPTVITLDTTKFRLADGRLATCAALPGDGGADAGEDAGSTEDAATEDAATEDAATEDAESPDATPAADSGAPLSFTQVRVRTRHGAQIVSDAVIACAASFSLEVVAEPARFDLDVGLLDSSGNLVDPSAQTACSVTSVVGTTSSAVCP